jgi:hypothetical protein
VSTPVLLLRARFAHAYFFCAIASLALFFFCAPASLTLRHSLRSRELLLRAPSLTQYFFCTLASLARVGS